MKIRPVSSIAAVALAMALSTGPAAAVDIKHDPNIIRNAPPGIPLPFAEIIQLFWLNTCWTACSSDGATSHAGGGQGGQSQGDGFISGYCFNADRCRQVFNEGNDNFYPSMNDVPRWPSNPHEINLPFNR